MAEVFHSSKQFVNLPGYNSDASIFTQILFYSPEYSGYDANLKLRDCGNSIHFAVGLHEEGDRSYSNTLFKLDVLISELSKFRESLVKAKIVYDEREKADQLRGEEARKELGIQTENYEVDTRHNNPATIGGINYPIDSPVRGLENIQATIPAPPNL